MNIARVPLSILLVTSLALPAPAFGRTAQPDDDLADLLREADQARPAPEPEPEPEQIEEVEDTEAAPTVPAEPDDTGGAPAPVPGEEEGPDPSTMSDEERLEHAKLLYGEGTTAMEQGNYLVATSKFQSAYNRYAPQLHVFNFNIGNAAFLANDCITAQKAFQRFLDLVPDHPERATAQEKILEMERSNCVALQREREAEAERKKQVQTTAVPRASDQEDAPILESTREQRERRIEKERERDSLDRAGPLMITGAVLMSVGLLTAGGGAVSMVLANQKAQKLKEEAAPGPLGFPSGDYSDDDLYDLDRNKLPSNNIASAVLFGAGGALTGLGIILMIAEAGHKARLRKKLNAKKAAHKPRFELAGVGPALGRGHAGAAASVRF